MDASSSDITVPETTASGSDQRLFESTNATIFNELFKYCQSGVFCDVMIIADDEQK